MYYISESEKIRRDRFQRIAPRRTENAIKEIRKIGNCANRQSYEYSEEEVKKIFAALEEEIENAKMEFPYFKKRPTKFTL